MQSGKASFVPQKEKKKKKKNYNIGKIVKPLLK
jgi:hypothetical protein